MGVRLPPEYQEVEYIESTGTQIIDTDYLPVDGDEMSIELSFSSYPPRGTYYCFAATDNSDPQVQLVFGTETIGKTLFYKYFSTGVAQKLRTNFAVDTIYRIDVAANGDCTCNGVTVSPINNLGYATGHLRFFARMAGNVNFHGRLYKFVASHGGIEKVDLVPCYRKADDEAGLYDLVSDTFFTNAGTGEFLVGPDVIDSISPLMVAWRRIMMAAASVAKKLVKLIATSTTGLVSFGTNVEMPTKVTCEFSPVQEGTGDPSPDNVRPISGWTGCEITHTGKNLFDKNSRSLWTQKKYLAEDGTEVSNNGWMITNYIPVKGTAFTLSSIGGNSPSICLYDVNKQYITGKQYGTSAALDLTDVTVSTTDEVAYIRFSINTLADLTATQLEIGDTATTYEEYRTPSTIQVTFTDPTTSDPLTVYGGTLTLNEDGSADLVVTHGRVNMGSPAWKRNDTSFPNRFRAQISGANLSGVTTSCEIGYYSRDIWNNTGSTGEFGVTNTDYIYFRHNSYTDATSFKNAVNGYYILYRLANPQSYHFDNIGQLKSFLGTNNIWHNTNGDITVEYWNKQ